MPDARIVAKSSVALTSHVAIDGTMTAGALHDRPADVGARLMAEAMARLEKGDLPLTPQPENGILHAAKIGKAESRIDFGRTAAELCNHIRGLSPFPGAWFEATIHGRPERVKVLGCEIAPGGGVPGTVLDDRLAIACGAGAIRPLRLQRAGGKPLDLADFLRGTPLPAGTRVG